MWFLSSDSVTHWNYFYYATLVQKPNIHMEMVKSEAENSDSISGHGELQI